MDFRRGRWDARGVFDDASTMHVELRRDGARLGRTATFAELAECSEARAVLVDVLRAAPFEAYFWETPPTDDDERLFECVLVDAPCLRGVRPNAEAFAMRFESDGTDAARVTAFANLGGDAELVVPSPSAEWDGAHLAVFVRSAPAALLDAFFRKVGKAAIARLDARGGPVWVSTSGLGISWLHVRIDERPKYYAHAPYRDARA